MAEYTITASEVLAIAKEEEGYLEKKSNSNLDSKTANAGSNNYTKYARDLVSWIGSPYQNGVAWCDIFVDWCVVKACIKKYGKEDGIKLAKKLLGGWSAYTPTSAQYYKDNKKWHSTPKVGDQVFFKNSQRICHTGLVYKVDSSHVYTVEGNTSSTSGVVANGGCVRLKSYTLGYSSIAGYGRPAYKSDTTKTTKTTKTSKDIPDLASCNPELKNGSTGSQVKLLQKDLNYVFNSKLTVDGNFGSKTENALKSFQSNCGLTKDGIYGTKTHAKMKAKLK